MKNIEIKARCDQLAHIREASRALGAIPHGVLHQIDTYFHVPVGRLKLREIESRTVHPSDPEIAVPPGSGVTASAELIFYRRPDDAGPKASEYEVAPVTEPSRMRAALAASLGTWIVVEKHRDLWILENVRIHLDTVERLGTFLELEAVVDADHPEDACRDMVDRLLARFGVESTDLVRDSYSDLLAAGAGAPLAP